MLFYPACRDDLRNKLIGIDKFRDSVLTVFSEKDFIEKAKMLKTPFAGVMYGGFSPTSGDRNQGIAAELRCGILIGLAPMRTPESEEETWVILHKVRKAILDTRAPIGHGWRYKGEVYLGDRGTPPISYFLMTWATFAPMVGETG